MSACGQAVIYYGGTAPCGATFGTAAGPNDGATPCYVCRVVHPLQFACACGVTIRDDLTHFAPILRILPLGGTPDAVPDMSAAGGGVAAAVAVPATTDVESPLVVGLDLSLKATGIAHMRGAQVVTDTITPPANRQSGLLRLRWLRKHLLELIGHPALVVVEGPSFGSVGAGRHDSAGLYWLVLDALWGRGVPVAIAPPANVKQYAVGVGSGKKASKDAVLLATLRRFPDFDGDNNAADALWLAAMGTDHLTGHSVVPEAHRAGLAKCSWPVTP